MITRKAGFFRSLLFLSAFIITSSIVFGTVVSAENTQIVVGENLKPGMALKDAIGLLGPPDTIRAGDTGTVIMPYDSLGLSIEAMSDGTVIEGIHIKSGFKGKFLSGIGIGAGFQEILSAYNQPDIMTKEVIEYSDRAVIFQISQGKLVGADLYNGESVLFHEVPSKYAGADAAEKKEMYEDKEADAGQDREVVEDEEVAADEDDERPKYDKNEIFELYGLTVRNYKDSVIITEIRPGSVAEVGGLKAGQLIRKAFYKGLSVRNIYTVGGLRALLTRAVDKRKKFINILQDENYYHKVEVPKRK